MRYHSPRHRSGYYRGSGHHDSTRHHDSGRHERGHGATSRYSDDHHGEDCRRVHKRGHFDGREARIGGTMCYDRHGEPYIVDGSRYVVEYY